MSKVVINSHTVPLREVDRQPFLRVSQLYYDTIQGEGIYTGVPAVFLRLQGCGLNCDFCDTKDIWTKGQKWGIDELVDIFCKTEIKTKLRQGAHLVLTGGSPLLQQTELMLFLEELKKKLTFAPFVEIENECVLDPLIGIIPLINCWNNSPKLPSSGYLILPKKGIAHLAALPNSWFKFVIQDETDWIYVKENYIETNIVQKNQIMLMPCAKNKLELVDIQKFVMQLCIENNIRYCDRLHIRIWNDKKDV